MFSIATPSEIRPAALPLSEAPASELARIGRLLLAVDSGVHDVARLLERPVAGGTRAESRPVRH